jgi:hypothetical protein
LNSILTISISLYHFTIISCQTNQLLASAYSLAGKFFFFPVKPFFRKEAGLQQLRLLSLFYHPIAVIFAGPVLSSLPIPSCLPGSICYILARLLITGLIRCGLIVPSQDTNTPPKLSTVRSTVLIITKPTTGMITQISHYQKTELTSK